MVFFIVLCVVNGIEWRMVQDVASKNPLEPLLVSESAPHQDVPQGQPGTKGSNPGAKNIPHSPGITCNEGTQNTAV